MEHETQTPAEIVTEEMVSPAIEEAPKPKPPQSIDISGVCHLANKTLSDAKALSTEASSVILLTQVVQQLVFEVRTIKHLVAEFIGVNHAPVAQQSAPMVQEGSDHG